MTSEDDEEAESDEEPSCLAASRNHEAPQDQPIRDALTGQVLERDLVAAARKKELDYFLTKKVWLKRHRNEAFQNTGKAPITVKWVDVNKGDDLNPNYRSRLVAREIRLPG